MVATIDSSLAQYKGNGTLAKIGAHVAHIDGILTGPERGDFERNDKLRVKVVAVSKIGNGKH